MTSVAEWLRLLRFGLAVFHQQDADICATLQRTLLRTLCMQRLFLFCCSLLLAGSLLAQAQLPSKWHGDWAGPLQIMNAAGPVQTIDMELHIHPGDSAHHTAYAIVYRAPERPVDERNYVLIGQSDQPGHFIMDERNSIYLDTYLYGDVMSSLFQVDESILLISYTHLGGDSIRFDVFPASTKEPRKSGEEAEVEVSSFRLQGFQQAILRREVMKD